MTEYHEPPSGWYAFGTHAAWDTQDIPDLEFSQEQGRDGLPLWERRRPCDHSRIQADLKDVQGVSEFRRKALFDAMLKARALESELEDALAEIERLKGERVNRAAFWNQAAF